MKNLFQRVAAVVGAAAIGLIILSGLVFLVAVLAHHYAPDSQIDFSYSPDSEEGPVIQIRYLGRDGKEGPTMPPYTAGAFTATAYDEDIIWADGFFVRYPAGAQVD